MRLRLPLAVTVVNVVLAAALVWLWTDDSRRTWKEPAPLPPALEAVAAADPPEAAEVSRYRETIERPLFLASRRPGPRKDSVGEPQEAVELRDVKLLGTYGAGNKGGIIVSRGGKVERVAVGSTIGRWTVAEGSGRSATLQRAGGERRTLELTLNTAPPPAMQSKPEGGASASAGDGAPRPSAAAALPAQPSQASAGAGSTSQRAVRAAARKARAERINAARARQGLPPLPE